MNLQPVYPALYLYSDHGAFIAKRLPLLNNRRVKIGRQMGTRVLAGELNGLFDSRVLSRQHAEVWEEGGKIWIKDVNSSNGTFINGTRIGSEGVASEPFELRTNDTVTFGVDITSEDTKTITHRKVVARVVCIFTEQDIIDDAQLGLNGNGKKYNMHAVNLPVLLGGMGGNLRPPVKSGRISFDQVVSRLKAELSKSRETGAELNSLASTINQVYNSLGESVPINLAYSRNPKRMPSYSGPNMQLPPQQVGAPGDSMYPQTDPFMKVARPIIEPPQLPISCLNSTQPEVNGSSTLHPSLLSASQVLSGIPSNTNSAQRPTLESVLEEQRVMMREFKSLRDMLQATKQEVESMRTGSGGDITEEQADIADQPLSEEQVTTAVQVPLIEEEETVDLADGDYDDTRSIITITMPHQLETIDEVDEEKELTIVDINVKVDDGIGPSEALEPTATESTTPSIALDTPEGNGSDTPPPRPSSPVSKWLSSSTDLDEQEEAEKVPQIDELEDPIRDSAASLALDSLSTRISKLEASLATSVLFQDRHAAVQSTVSALQDRISTLEDLVQTTQAKLEAQTVSSIPAPTAPSPSPSNPDTSLERESLVQMFESWKQTAERQWLTVREECEQERARLQKAREELELQTKIIQVSIAPEMIIRRDEITPLTPSLYVSPFDGPSPVVAPPSPPTTSDDECSRKPKPAPRGRSRRGVGMAAAVITAPNLLSSSPLASDVEDDQNRKESHTSTIMGLLTPNLSRKSSESDSTLTHILKEARGFEESRESHLKVPMAVGILVMSGVAAAVILR